MIWRPVIPNKALRWGRLTCWWPEWSTGLRKPPDGHLAPDLIVWGDL